jgi:hypothetical protein
MVGLVWACIGMMMTCSTAKADIRVNLVNRLDEILNDQDNTMMSEANKIVFLDAVGVEYGRRGFYIKRDTITTTSQTETYALNTDFAGTVEGAYLKRGNMRVTLPVIDRDSAFRLSATLNVGEIAYVYVGKDGRLGVEALPLRVDTIILSYSAYPAALSGDSTEWDLLDWCEQAAVFEAAADIIHKEKTVWAEAKATAFLNTAKEKLAEMRDPPSDSRKVGITDR